MTKSRISQGPWTRIRPLQRDELDVDTHAGMMRAEITWGSFPNNLARVMAHCPKLLQTEVEYCNSFIFDPPQFRSRSEFDEPGRRDDRDYEVSELAQTTGFNDRFIKELVISKTSLINRSRYSITHHTFLGYILYTVAGRAEEAHIKYLHLHEHDQHPDVYTERENVILDFTDKVVRDAHLVSDDDFQQLRKVLKDGNREDDALKTFSDEQMERHVDSQIVELTWLIGHFCLLNRWFTVLQVPDEGPDDELSFLEAYEKMIPADIRERNENILQGDF